MNYQEAYKILDAILPENIPVMLWGAPGVGKSSLIREICETHRIPLVDVRLAQLDPTDLRGIPVPNRDERLVEWFPPAFLPREGKGILFLDELDKAPVAVKNAALQLVLDRRVGDYVLPAEWRIVAAGNREGDNALSIPMGTALANRMIHLHVEADSKGWVRWARVKGLADDIIAFIQFRPDLLHAVTKETAFPSPRTWEMLSRLIRRAPNGDLRPIVYATVGAGAGKEFVAWRKYYVDTDVDGILTGRIPDLEGKDRSFSFAVVLAVANRIREKAAPEWIPNIASLVKALSAEFKVLFVKQLSEKVVTALVQHPAFRPQAEEIMEILFGQDDTV